MIKMIPSEERCKQEGISDSSGFHFHRCYRRATKDGYCKQHHPDIVAERQRKSHEEYERKWKESPIMQLIEVAKKLEEAKATIVILSRENEDLKEKIKDLEAEIEDLIERDNGN